MHILQGKITKHSRPVRAGEDISHLIPEMEYLCSQPIGIHKLGAVALAHCQVDDKDPMRFFVIRGSTIGNGRVIINPKILEKDGRFMHPEGCMSFAFRGNKKVMRYQRIKVSFIEGGEEMTEEVDGLLSCVFQHEIEHFNGSSIFQ